MRRPLVYVALGYLIGIIWGLYFKQISIAIFFVAIVYIMLKFYCRGVLRTPTDDQRSSLRFILLVCTILLGLFTVTYKIHKIESIYSKLENKNIEVIGTLISNKQEGNYYDIYKVKIEKIFHNSTEIKGVRGIKVITYIKKNINYLQYGNKVYFTGSFEIPSGRRNYKGFNYKQYLNSQNIFGIIKADLKQNKVIKENNINTIFQLSNNLKLKIISNTNEVFPSMQAGVLIGMLIGETTYIRRRNEQ